MTRNELVKALGDIVALVLSAALIIATVIAINIRIASASFEVIEESSPSYKHVEESLDAPAPCDYVLAKFETLAGESAPCAAEDAVAKWMVPGVDIGGDCWDGYLWLVEFTFEESKPAGGCLSAEESL